MEQLSLISKAIRSNSDFEFPLRASHYWSQYWRNLRCNFTIAAYNACDFTYQRCCWPKSVFLLSHKGSPLCGLTTAAIAVHDVLLDFLRRVRKSRLNGLRSTVVIPNFRIIHIRDRVSLNLYQSLQTPWFMQFLRRVLIETKNSIPSVSGIILE